MQPPTKRKKDQFKDFVKTVSILPQTGQLKTKEKMDELIPSSQSEGAYGYGLPDEEAFDIASAVAAILEDASEEAASRTSLSPQKCLKKKRKSKSSVAGSSNTSQTLVTKPSKSRTSSRKSQKSKGIAAGSGHKTGSAGHDSMTSIYGGGKTVEGGQSTLKPRENPPVTFDLKDEATALESTSATSHHHHQRSASTPAGHRIQQPNPLPKNPNQADVQTYLGRVNSYIKRLGYHHVGEPGIRVITHLSLRHHMETARQLIKSGENIKCLHALLLGIHLTNCTPLIERFPVNFKSKLNGKEFRHVVLGIYVYGAYGALGLSRDAGLQDKPATYSRLSDLLIDYAQCYEKSGHVLMEIKLGGIISRDTTAQCGIPWKIGVLHMAKYPDLQHFAGEADKLAKLLKGQMGQACIRHLRPSESMVPVGSSPYRSEASKTSGNVGPSTHILEKAGGSKVSKPLPGASSSKLTTTAPRSTSIASPAKSATGTKAKKRKVLKHKRFAEP